MKKIPMLAAMALMLMFGCSKDTLTDAEQDYVQFEESSKTDLTGKGKSFSGNVSLNFMSNSTINTDFITDCLPDGTYLLRQGTFSGKINGYGKINSSLSSYEFISCEELPNNTINNRPPYVYALVAEGTLALSTRDYCKITITGILEPYFYAEYGYYGALFTGTATTYAGFGKLKALDNKNFTAYNGTNRGGAGPTVNLETGVISLWFSDYEYMQ